MLWLKSKIQFLVTFLWAKIWNLSSNSNSYQKKKWKNYIPFISCPLLKCVRLSTKHEARACGSNQCTNDKNGCAFRLRLHFNKALARIPVTCPPVGSLFLTYTGALGADCSSHCFGPENEMGTLAFESLHRKYMSMLTSDSPSRGHKMRASSNLSGC